MLPGFIFFELERKIESRHRPQANRDFSNTSSVIIPTQADCIWERDGQWKYTDDFYSPSAEGFKMRRIGNDTRCKCYNKYWVNHGYMPRDECAQIAAGFKPTSSVSRPTITDSTFNRCYTAEFLWLPGVCGEGGGGSTCSGELCPDGTCCTTGSTCELGVGGDQYTCRYV